MGETVRETGIRFPILADPLGFELSNRLAPADVFENVEEFVGPSRWLQNRRRVTDDFLGGVSKEPLGAGVPGKDHTVQISTENGVFRGVHNRGEEGARLFGLLALGDLIRAMQGKKMLLFVLRYHAGIHLGANGSYGILGLFQALPERLQFEREFLFAHCEFLGSAGVDPLDGPCRAISGCTCRGCAPRWSPHCGPGSQRRFNYTIQAFLYFITSRGVLQES